MKRKKQIIKNFMHWLEYTQGVKMPPVTFAWNRKAVASPDGYGFGVLCINGERDHIYIAGDWPKSFVMYSIAHEYAHHCQFERGDDMDWTEVVEKTADDFAIWALKAYSATLRFNKIKTVYVASEKIKFSFGGHEWERCKETWKTKC